MSARSRSVLQRSLTFRGSTATIPLQVVATDATTGEQVLVSGGAVGAITAASIPGVSAGERGGPTAGRRGGGEQHPDQSRRGRGFPEDLCAPDRLPIVLGGRPPRSALGMVLQSLTLLLAQGLAATSVRGRCRPHGAPAVVSARRVTGRLLAANIERARVTSGDWLDRPTRCSRTGARPPPP